VQVIGTGYDEGWFNAKSHGIGSAAVLAFAESERAAGMHLRALD
jgi:hypothetical protein